MVKEIKKNKWYYMMLGYGGCASVYVAPFEETEVMATGVSLFFGDREQARVKCRVWKAVDRHGEVHEVSARDIDAPGIGGLREAFDVCRDLTPTKLENLLRKGKMARERERLEEERRAAEDVIVRAELRKRYSFLPNVAGEGEWRPYGGKVTANIRALLKAEFPGVKFSVRLGGGDAVRVSWSGGPEEKEVGRVAGMFEDSYFDGMQDMTVSNVTNFNKCFGGVGYVFLDHVA